MRMRWTAWTAALALGACQQAPRVDDAWVRLPALPGRPAAGYATLTSGSADRVLLAIETPAAARVELHRSMTGHGGMATMQPLDRLDVPRGAVVRLAPGGNHAMLFDLRGDLKPGGTVPMTFRFADGAPVTTTARLIAVGDPAPE